MLTLILILVEYLFKGFDKIWGARNVRCRRYDLRTTWNWKRQCMYHLALGNLGVVLGLVGVDVVLG